MSVSGGPFSVEGRYIEHLFVKFITDDDTVGKWGMECMSEGRERVREIRVEGGENVH